MPLRHVSPVGNPVGANRPTVAVTGCSSGIGAATARLLAEAGFHVLAGVRNPLDGNAIAAEHELIEPIILDVTREQDVAAFADRLDRLPNGLAGLVNNAGIVNVGPIEGLPLQRWQQALDVNVVGTIAVTRAAIPSVIRARGRIVNVSSPVARVSLPMLGPYAITKAALAAFTDTLRRELVETGVRVVEVTPGSIATPIFDKGVDDGVSLMQAGHPHFRELYGPMAGSAIEAGRRASVDGAPPERAAEAIVRAMTARRPKVRHYLGIENRAVGFITRVLPVRLADWLIVRVTRDEQWSEQPELQMLPAAEDFFAEGSDAIIAPVNPTAESLWSAASHHERHSVRSDLRSKPRRRRQIA